MKTLQATEGHVYVSADNKSYGQIVLLPDSADESQWREMTESAGKKIVEKTLKDEYEQFLKDQSATVNQAESSDNEQDDSNLQPEEQTDNMQ